MNEINTKCVTNCVEGYYLIKVHRYHFCFCVLKLFSVPFLLCICGSIIFILGLKFYYFFCLVVVSNSLSYTSYS